MFQGQQWYKQTSETCIHNIVAIKEIFQLNEHYVIFDIVDLLSALAIYLSRTEGVCWVQAKLRDSQMATTASGTFMCNI